MKKRKMYYIKYMENFREDPEKNSKGCFQDLPRTKGAPTPSLPVHAIRDSREPSNTGIQPLISYLDRAITCLTPRPTLQIAREGLFHSAP